MSETPFSLDTAFDNFDTWDASIAKATSFWAEHVEQSAGAKASDRDYSQIEPLAQSIAD